MGLINVAIAGLVEDFIWFIQKEYKMKKTLKSGKNNVKTQPGQMLEQADKAAMEMSLRQAGIKKTMLKKKKDAKKIWVSRDDNADDCIVDLWTSKPKKDKHGLYTYGLHFIDELCSLRAQNAFGKIPEGQCKCFEIREVKE